MKDVSLTELIKCIDLREVLISFGIEFEQYRESEVRFICPFHHEKQPSCSLNLKKGIFHCFGCNQSGSVVKLIQEFNNCTSKDAINKLVTFAGGVSLEEFKVDLQLVSENTKFVSGIEGLNGHKEVKPIDRRFIDKCLEDPKYNYWYGRGYERETLEFFEIGYCRFGHYKGKYIIPIYNEDGILVGFSSRGKTDGPSKYEHMGKLDKKNILYNLHNAKDYLPETPLLLVEGFTDVWRAHQAGYPCAVAVMGSVLNREQERLLMKNVYSLILGLDGDEAGRKLTSKLSKEFKNLMDLRVLRLPRGRDIGDLTDEEFKEYIGGDNDI